LSEKSLGIKIDDELYTQVKVMLAERGITLRECITELLKKEIEAEKTGEIKYDYKSERL
jgi:antitoxin component of RelBE/YafQ-DinJ toxin-antitoxin module